MGLRESSEEQKSRFGEKYKHFLKFVPESIWAWNSGQFLTDSEVYNVIGKHLSQGYTVIDELEGLLKLFQLVARKGLRIF